MNLKNKPMRAVALGVLLAVLLRMIFSLALGNVWEIFSQPKLASFLIQSESGREPPETTAPVTTQPTTEPTEPPTTEPVTEPTLPPVTVPQDSALLTEEDVAYVEMQYSASRNPDIEALLTKPLMWNLTGEDPAVLIVHTHGTEAFTPTEDRTYEENGGEFRTTDDRYNMISVGDELTRLLEEAGINVVHDRTYYDYPDYLAAYDNAREGTKDMLAQYPTVKLVIDLHRDAAEYADGTQWATSATVNGEKSAQVMFVLGTDSYYNHPNWQENLSVALKLNALMEKSHPGVTRPIDLRKQRFNQDLTTGAMIAEIGAAGNTHEEAMNAISVLAEAIILLAHGANQ